MSLSYSSVQRRYPIGAEVQPNGGAHFRVWAPRRKKVDVVLEAGPGAPATLELKPEADGYFAGLSRRRLRVLVIASGWMKPVAFLTRCRGISRTGPTGRLRW